MNKLIALVVASLISINLGARNPNGSCFPGYQGTLANESNGLAEITKSEGLAGITRGDELVNNQSKKFYVKKRGAKLKVKFGPEDKKVSKNVQFYGKTGFSPRIILTQNNIVAEDFNTVPKPYSVKIINQSAGKVKVLDVCGISGHPSDIDRGKTVTITATPGAWMDVKIGPEKYKVNRRLVFSEPFPERGVKQGDIPTLTIHDRGATSHGIRSSHRSLLNVQRQPNSLFQQAHKPSIKAMPKKINQRQKQVRGLRSKSQNIETSSSSRRHIRTSQLTKQ